MRNGFTLSELLIALAILGVIATFTIPKVLQSQQDQKTKAVLKETIASLSDILHTGRLNGTIIPGGDNASVIYSRLNAIKICDTDAQAQGCFSQPAPSAPGERNQPGAILPSGATIAGLFISGWEPNPNEWEDMFLVDANGAAEPNQEGKDQIALTVCYGSNEWCTNSWGRRGTIRAPSGWTSETYYEEIFTK